MSRTFEEETLLSQLELFVGTPVSMMVSPGNQRYESSVIGFRHGEYVMLDYPDIGHLAYRRLLNKRLTVYCYHSGSIYSFDSEIIGRTSKPVSTLILSYPAEVTRRGLRSTPRTNCCLPASVTVEKDVFRGLLVDISARGCRFVHQADDGPRPEMEVPRDVEVSFLLGRDCLPLTFLAEAVQRQATGSLTVLGLKFNRVPGDDQLEVVEDYVQDAIRHSVEIIQRLSSAN